MSKSTKTKKTYTTMRGKTIDMDILRKKNELVPAVGNARVNARGDELGPNGTILRKREDIVKEYYEKMQSSMPNENGHFTAPDKSNNKPNLTEQLDLTEEEKAMLAEDQEWTEDESGNFVKKNESKPSQKTTAKTTTKKS